jgi:hypothetical protein
VWMAFALDHQGDLKWPRGQRIALVLDDGTVVRDSIAWVTSPAGPPRFEMRPYPALGTIDLRIEQGELQRKRYPWGAVCTSVIVGFPFGSWTTQPRRIVALQCR